MAIEQINTAAFDYDMMLAFIEGTVIGKADITISEYSTTAAPDVKVGSKFEVNGALFKVLTADETPTGYAGIANSTTFYLMYDVSAEAFVFTSVAPSWNDALQGWYETGETDRYFFRMYKDSGGTLYGGKGALRHKSLGQEFTMEIGDWNMDTTINVEVPHGIDHTKIRGISVLIRGDAGSALEDGRYLLNRADGDRFSAYSQNSANIILERVNAGFFDGINFNDTSFNRGWITIQYTE